MTSKAYAVKVGDRIRDQRVALGLSQAELAEEMGMSDAAISSWERGEKGLSAYNSSRLKAFFKKRRSEIANAVQAVSA